MHHCPKHTYIHENTGKNSVTISKFLKLITYLFLYYCNILTFKFAVATCNDMGKVTVEQNK
jgi:hypothetical protein